MKIGKGLVSLVALWGAFGSYVFDWNVTHIFNPRWSPHAKFHNAQDMLLGSSIGLLALVLLWGLDGEERRRVRLASVLASLYWLTQMGALAFPGTALVDPEFDRPGLPPVQLIVDVVMLAILGIGYVFESRRFERCTSHAHA